MGRGWWSWVGGVQTGSRVAGAAVAVEHRGLCLGFLLSNQLLALDIKATHEERQRQTEGERERKGEAERERERERCGCLKFCSQATAVSHQPGRKQTVGE